MKACIQRCFITAVLAILGLCAVASAGSISCPRDYPSGRLLLRSDGGMDYPNGRLLRRSDGGMDYPDGRLLRRSDGGMDYPDGRLLRRSDGGMDYPTGRLLRSSDGSVYDQNGSVVSDGISIRFSVPMRPWGTLIVRAGKNRESYELVFKDGRADIRIVFDEQQNIDCEVTLN